MSIMATRRWFVLQATQERHAHAGSNTQWLPDGGTRRVCPPDCAVDCSSMLDRPMGSRATTYVGVAISRSLPLCPLTSTALSHGNLEHTSPHVARATWRVWRPVGIWRAQANTPERFGPAPWSNTTPCRPRKHPPFQPTSAHGAHIDGAC